MTNLFQANGHAGRVTELTRCLPRGINSGISIGLCELIDIVGQTR
jgi:hypothetical protein